MAISRNTTINARLNGAKFNAIRKIKTNNERKSSKVIYIKKFATDLSHVTNRAENYFLMNTHRTLCYDAIMVAMIL